MKTEHSSCDSGLPGVIMFQNPDQCLPAAGPTDYRLMEVQLRNALAQSEALVRQKDELIQRQELLKKDPTIGC